MTMQTEHFQQHVKEKEGGGSGTGYMRSVSLPASYLRHPSCAITAIGPVFLSDATRQNERCRVHAKTSPTMPVLMSRYEPLAEFVLRFVALLMLLAIRRHLNVFS